MPREELKKNLQFEDLEVRRTELAFVTAINRKNKTFFAQFCKFSNEELEGFNAAINLYCREIFAGSDRGDANLSDLEPGYVCCAKYALDGCWYRSIVKSKSETDSSCKVTFIDYGNSSTVSIADIILANNTRLPIIKRAPFGVFCRYKSFGEPEDTEHKKLLSCLYQNYAMLKFLGDSSDQPHLVDIPIHAYNIPIWHTFKTDSDPSGEGFKNGVAQGAR